MYVWKVRNRGVKEYSHGHGYLTRLFRRVRVTVASQYVARSSSLCNTRVESSDLLTERKRVSALAHECHVSHYRRLSVIMATCLLRE
jgi:hypothetical protein